jgi:S-DNA-T family DNA segregation ATPase FtsK/SpoIIIE
MNKDELIGHVGVTCLKSCLDQGAHEEGVARYLLDCLSAEQTAAIALAVLANPVLAAQIEIKLPANFVGDMGLPAAILTHERTTYYRNAQCAKSALLVASTGDDERFSLKELTPIGADQLLACPENWVECVCTGLGRPETEARWWAQCLRGLLQVRAFPLERVAGYVLDTAHRLGQEGEPLLVALGLALPALRIPRDRGLFTVLNEKTAGHASRWSQLFTKAIRRRACYLLKQTPSQSLLTGDQLTEAFAKVQDSVPPEYHDPIRGFIEASSGWNLAAERLCDCEWEGISPLFDGLRREQFNLGEKTAQFFDERYPDRLSAAETDYLKRLRDRNYTSPEEEDEAFYESYRQDLKDDPTLKSKWDRFVFGAPVECDDFLAGLVACMEGFFDQNATGQASRQLRIRSDKRTVHELKTLNEDAGLSFSLLYRALPKVLPASITWDIGELFNYESHHSEWRKLPRPRLNRSTAKAALRIRFYLEFHVTQANGSESVFTKQLVWTFSPSGVPCELQGDLERLAQHPFTPCYAAHEPIGPKGTLQALDLRDSATLHACYAQDRGSLVPAYKKANDLLLLWQGNLDAALADGFVSAEAAQSLREHRASFDAAYSAAVTGLREDGYSEELRTAAERFGVLVELVRSAAPGDRARSLLLRPLLELGCAPIGGDNPACIVAPWHPLRMLATHSKIAQASALLGRLLSDEPVAFSDTRLFFRDFGDALQTPYYPEVAIGWRGEQPQLLGCTDYFLGYSLHESPIAEDSGHDDTNENPGPAADLVLELAQRYLHLYPHERTSFSTVLYNCDSARLPQAVVEKMDGLGEGENSLRCEVVLRHRDQRKLAELYEKIVESTSDGDALYAGSETSADFMARLRIAIMADQAPAPREEEGRPADLVFLHDVIARHARIGWYEVTRDQADATGLCPATWSRRRPAAVDDMKSVVYLDAPVQTPAGWQYLSAVSSFFESGQRCQPAACLLPARVLDFNEEATRIIFTETHNLGNWVANYDELLDRRQLQNQGVRVIRFKQTHSQGRNVLVSSKAPLGLLKSMVKQRIAALTPELTQDQIDALATRFIADANAVSGDLALRAAKRGRSASETPSIKIMRAWNSPCAA